MKQHLGITILPIIFMKRNLSQKCIGNGIYVHIGIFMKIIMNQQKKDSYYHICSDHSDYIRMLAFIRKLMYSLLGDKQDWYSDKDKELDELVLKDFEIVEVK